jgi:hypothetical protein
VIIRGMQWIYLLVILLLFCAPGHGRMGYEITAKADSTTWHLARSVQAMDFLSNSIVVGEGNFSKYGKIKGFVGVDACERSNAQKGKLGYGEQQILRAREGSVTININLDETTVPVEDDPDQQDNYTFSTTGSADIEVFENWRAYYSNKKKINYESPIIRERETNNNNDVVSTSIESQKLSKDSTYKGYVNGTYIHAYVTPGGVSQDIRQNRTSQY